MPRPRSIGPLRVRGGAFDWQRHLRSATSGRTNRAGVRLEARRNQRIGSAAGGVNGVARRSRAACGVQDAFPTPRNLLQRRETREGGREPGRTSRPAIVPARRPAASARRTPGVVRPMRTTTRTSGPLRCALAQPARRVEGRNAASEMRERVGDAGRKIRNPEEALPTGVPARPRPLLAAAPRRALRFTPDAFVVRRIRQHRRSGRAIGSVRLRARLRP